MTLTGTAILGWLLLWVLTLIGAYIYGWWTGRDQFADEIAPHIKGIEDAIEKSQEKKGEQ